MNVSKKLFTLFFCIMSMSSIQSLEAMLESKTEPKEGCHGASFDKRIHGAMAAMQSAVDSVTFKASQARDDKEIVELMIEKMVDDVMKTPECIKKLGRLSMEIRYDFVRGLALAWAKIPNNFKTAEDCIRALRRLRKKLPQYLLHELEYGEAYNKKMFGE